MHSLISPTCQLSVISRLLQVIAWRQDPKLNHTQPTRLKAKEFHILFSTILHDAFHTSGFQHATTFYVEAPGWHLVARPALFFRPLSQPWTIHSGHRSCWHLGVVHHKLQIWSLGWHIQIHTSRTISHLGSKFLHATFAFRMYDIMIQLARDSRWPILGQGWAKCFPV